MFGLRKSINTKTSGVTLVEVMVGIALLTLIFFTMQSFLTPGLKTAKVGNTTYSDLVTLTSLLEYLKRDIRICQKFKATPTVPEAYFLSVVKEKPVVTGSLNLIEIVYEQKKIKNTKGEVLYVVERAFTNKATNKRKIIMFEFINKFELKLEKDPNTLNMIRITKLALEKQTMIKNVQNLMINIDYSGAIAGVSQEVKMLETIGARSFYREIKDMNKP